MIKPQVDVNEKSIDSAEQGQLWRDCPNDGTAKILGPGIWVKISLTHKINHQSTCVYLDFNTYTISQIKPFLLTEYHCVQTIQYESPVKHWNQYCYLTIFLLPRALASNKCIGFKENSGSTLCTVLPKQTLMKLHVKQPNGCLGKLLKICLLESSSYKTISLLFPWLFLILWHKQMKRECFWTRFSLLFIFSCLKVISLILPNQQMLACPSDPFRALVWWWTSFWNSTTLRYLSWGWDPPAKELLRR